MSFNLLFQKANELYLNGAYQEAEKIYRQILAFTPENADVLNMLGLVAASKGEHEAACPYFYKALKTASNPLPIYFNLAISLTNIQKYEEAIEAYQNVLKYAPNNKEAYNNLGGIYESLKDTENAKLNYKKALEIEQNYIDAAVNLAVLEKDKDKLILLSKTNKTSALPLYYLALYSFDAGLYDKALDDALKADKLEQAYDIKNLIAQIFLKRENETNADKYFHQALLLNPKSIDALINLGVLEKNETYLKKAISLHPKDFKPHLVYADFLYQEKRASEALEEYRKALLFGGDNAALSNNLALVLKDMEDYKGALDLLLNAFMKDKQNKNIAINIAETLVLLNESEPSEALKIAKLWQKNAPDNIFANKTLASFEKDVSFDDVKYAKELFDEFAPVYDKRMSDIQYNILDKIKELNPELKGNILDLGCGTGLAAEKLKTQSSQWTGVDISKKMIQLAAQKDLYKELFEEDISDFLEKNKLKFNFILCLDVVEYIKDFEKLLKLCFPSNLILSIEKAPENIESYQLSSKGRYQHNPLYTTSLLNKIGYKNIQSHQLILRKENGKEVEGVLFIAS